MQTAPPQTPQHRSPLKRCREYTALRPRARFGAPGSTVNDARTCARRATTRSRSSSLTIRNSGRSTTCQASRGWARGTRRFVSGRRSYRRCPKSVSPCTAHWRGSAARSWRSSACAAAGACRRGSGAPRYASPRSRARTTRRYRRSLRPGPDQRGAGRQSKSRAEVAAEPRVAGASHSGHLTRHPSAWRAACPHRGAGPCAPTGTVRRGPGRSPGPRTRRAPRVPTRGSRLSVQLPLAPNTCVAALECSGLRTKCLEFFSVFTAEELASLPHSPGPINVIARAITSSRMLKVPAGGLRRVERRSPLESEREGADHQQDLWSPELNP